MDYESSDESEIIENNEEQIELSLSLSEDESEKKEVEENTDEEQTEEEETEEETEERFIIDKKYKKILNYKKENLKKFSYYAMLNYLCKVVSYIKNGGKILDSITDFDYPNITEESYAVESILLSKDPFVYILNNKEIEIDTETRLLTMKLVLRPADTNYKIFFTKDFRNKFPKFIKYLFNDYITKEELEEIENLKQ